MLGQTDRLLATSAPAKSSLSKTILLRLLDKLQHGYLVLTDGDMSYTFGDPSLSLHAELVVHDQAFYGKALYHGTVGAGESYIDGQWDSPALEKLVQLLVRNMSLLDRIDHVISAPMQWARRAKNLLRHNSKEGSKRNILAHYDLGNDFYELFLDPTMAYSCALFEEGDSLEQAQLRKFDAICQRLDLKPGETLVEIGTGWGGLAIHAAQHYGVHVTTTTISDRQHEYAAARIKKHGLTENITLLKEDYRDLEGQYDKLVSIEMLEAVGHRYFSTYFQTCEKLLKPGGTLLIQSITIVDQRYERYRHQVDFIQRYVFPGGFLPSVNALSDCIANKTQMQVTELHDMGSHYATTLRHWSTRLSEAKTTLNEQGKDDAFYRLWQFYFHYCEGGFLEKSISTVHLLAQRPKYGS